MCSKGESCIVPVSSPHSFHTVASIFTFNKIVKKEGPLCVCPVQSGGFPFEVPRSAAPETAGLEMSLIRVSVSFNLLTCGFSANCCYQTENLQTDICDEIPASSPHLELFKHYATTTYIYM